MEKESLLVFDVESDGFLEEATVVHVISAKAYPDGKLVSFYGDTLTDFFEYAKQFDVLCGHNAIDFDLPLLKKLHGFEWEWPRRVVDTLVMSRLQRPDRQLPPHCLDKSVGPHSVEAWGYRLGRIKPGHEDWSVFSAEMLHRNREDVEIQCRILSTLIEEGQGEGWENAHKLNARLFSLLKKQELCGWTFDVKAAQKGIETLDRYMAMIDKAVGPRLPIISERLEKKDKEDGYSYVKKPFKQNGDKAKRVYEYMGNDVDQVWGAFSRVSFRRVDITARAETVSYLLARGWEPLEWNYNKLTGEKTSPKLSKREEFIGVETKEGKLIAKRVICRARRGILQGWLASVRPDGRIPTPTNGMATTGRIKHAVVVNVPSPSTKSFFAKHMRAVFIPQAGWVMIGCDSAGNQIRQLAARMQDDEFTKAVLFGKSDDGTDLHSLNQRRASLETRTLAKNFFFRLTSKEDFMSNHDDKNSVNSGDTQEGNPEPSLKRCNHCQVDLDLSRFHRSKFGVMGRHAQCKACRSDTARNKYVQNPFRVMHRTKKYWCGKYNIPYDLDEDYISSIWTGVCPITGEQLTVAQERGYHWSSAWLDRIVPALGYVKGNVAFISPRMNRIKYDASLQDLELLVAWLRKVQRPEHMLVGQKPVRSAELPEMG